MPHRVLPHAQQLSEQLLDTAVYGVLLLLLPAMLIVHVLLHRRQGGAHVERHL